MTLASVHEEVVKSTPSDIGGLFHSTPSFERSPEGDERQRWQCPYCSHGLTFCAEDRDVVELAVRSHMTRRHWCTSAILERADAKRVSLLDLTNMAPGLRVPLPSSGTKPGR